MPTVAIVEGVKIQVFAREHPPPHFHAVLAEYRVEIGIEPLSVINGHLPTGKLNAILAWALVHREALKRAWDLVQAGEHPGKIE